MLANICQMNIRSHTDSELGQVICPYVNSVAAIALTCNLVDHFVL